MFDHPASARRLDWYRFEVDRQGITAEEQHEQFVADWPGDPEKPSMPPDSAVLTEKVGSISPNKGEIVPLRVSAIAAVRRFRLRRLNSVPWRLRR